MASLLSSVCACHPLLYIYTISNQRFHFISRNLNCSNKIVKFNQRITNTTPLIPRASVRGLDYAVELGTNENFQKELTLPGCSNSLVLLGTGYREKVFAVIGVKVYAVGFYIESSIKDQPENLKENQSADVSKGSSIFSSMFNLPLAKSLYIKLVRDVDGKTFWNALNDVISPRIKSLKADDQSALATFQSIFQSRNLKEGTCIILTWLEPSKMLISISLNQLPSGIDAEIKSVNVNLALYDGFFGDQPVSPTLKASVTAGLKTILN